MSHTTVQTDDLDQYDWDTITTTYADDETTVTQVETLYDNGLIERWTYEDGELVSREYIDIDDPSRNPTQAVIDSGGLYSWSYVELGIGENPNGGHYIYENIRTDDSPLPGTNAATSVVASHDTLETIEVELDLDGSEPWELRFDTHRADGTLEHQVIFEDDGYLRRTNHYADGAIQGYRWSDLGKNESWGIIDVSYDEAGTIRGIRVFLDDNTSVYSVYDATGTLVSKFWNDQPGNIRDWKTKTIEYNPDGTAATQSVNYDDGRSLTLSYNNGVPEVQLLADTLDAYDWSTIITIFDANGDKMRKTLTDDLGVVTDTFYFMGEVDKIETSDSADAYAWDEKLVDYEDGELVLSAVLEDDGDVSAVYFSDTGKVSIYEDVSDSRDWYARVQTYDASGALVSTEYYDSYEDLNAATGYTSPFADMAA